VYSPSNAPALSVTLGVLQLLANHYPERLYKAYVVNAPSIFQMAWKVSFIVSVFSYATNINAVHMKITALYLYSVYVVKITKHLPDGMEGEHMQHLLVILKGVALRIRGKALYKAYVVNARSILQVSWRVREHFNQS
jgi:hypothetical protein